jgi:hypothetical protein
MFASFAISPKDFAKLRFFNGLSSAPYVDSADLKSLMEKPPDHAAPHRATATGDGPEADSPARAGRNGTHSGGKAQPMTGRTVGVASGGRHARTLATICGRVTMAVVGHAHVPMPIPPSIPSHREEARS